MSAINVLRTKDVVHIITDAAAYDEDGVLQAIKPKCYAMPHMPAALATRGPSRATDIIAMCLGALFRDFDELVLGIEYQLPLIVEQTDELRSEYAPRIELILVGWSAERGRPETYFMQTESNPWQPEHGETLAGELQNPEPFKLQQQPECLISPNVDPEDMVEANKSLSRNVNGIDELDPAIDGLRLLEVQRQQRRALVPGGAEAHWIGGFGLLTSVRCDRVEQRVIGRWPDEVGQPILPEPVDWEIWNREHRLPGAPEHLSRLREQMLERKAQKLARRRS